jgi:hypothetical protein
MSLIMHRSVVAGRVRQTYSRTLQSSLQCGDDAAAAWAAHRQTTNHTELAGRWHVLQRACTAHFGREEVADGNGAMDD